MFLSGFDDPEALLGKVVDWPGCEFVLRPLFIWLWTQKGITLKQMSTHSIILSWSATQSKENFPSSCFSISSEIAICCTQGRDYFASGWILWTIIVFLCYVFIRSFIIRAHLFCCGRVESMCLLRKIVQVTSIHLKVVKIMLLHVNVAFYCSNFASLNTLNSSRCLI